MSTSTILDLFESQLKLVCGWDVEDESHGLAFATGPMLTDSDLQQIESTHGITLPGDYREFLMRFGDGDIGPGNEFVPLSSALTPNARKPFSLQKPFLGDLSPDVSQIPEADRRNAFGLWLKEWQSIPKDHGTLRICEYGCNMAAVLILDGPYSGRVWIYSGDSAYFGPFGCLLEALHNQATDLQFTANPTDYSFLEWYGHWLKSEVGEVEFENS